jgi:hypothetical protein
MITWVCPKGRMRVLLRVWSISFVVFLLISGPNVRDIEEETTPAAPALLINPARPAD